MSSMRLINPFLFVLLIMIGGCKSTSVVPGTEHKGEVDKYGCTLPPADVLQKTGIDIKLAASSIGKIATGDFSIKIDPQIVQLTSQAVSNESVRSYLRCLARERDHYSPAQQGYFELLSGFLDSKPSSDQFLLWQSKNPFPSGGKTSNGASINFPVEVSINTAIKSLAKTEGFAVEFKQCSEDKLKLKIQNGEMSAAGVKELIEKLPLYITDKSKVIKYNVTKLEGKGIYEISCN